MLGLHNILLIASSQQTQNPNTISSDHHHNQDNPPNLNNQDCNFNGSSNPWNLNTCQELSIARKDVGDESSGSLGTCTDCGNKAKKECKYRRCRTCCKSRGYDCSTHVKSTWVPASKRREKHQVGGGGGGGGYSGSSSGGVKRPRIVSSSQNVTTATSNSVSSNAAAAPASFCFDTGSSHQDPSFKQSLPAKVKAPAVFRCIRVTAISGEEAEVLYQATVNICGHVFKGFLYNQGIDEKKAYPCISKLNLESSINGREFSVPIVEPSNAYAAPGNRK